MLSWAVVTAVIVCGAILARAAWTTWPQVLQYRIQRIDRRTTLLVQQYLDGKDALDSTACRLANLYDQKTFLTGLLLKSSRGRSLHAPPPGGGSLEAIVVAVPAGLSPDDARMKVLGTRMWACMPHPTAIERLAARKP